MVYLDSESGFETRTLSRDSPGRYQMIRRVAGANYYNYLRK